MTAAILTLALALSVQGAPAQAPSKPAASKPPAVVRQASRRRPARPARPDGSTTPSRSTAAASRCAPTGTKGRWYLGSSLYERDRYAEAHDAFAALIARRPTHAGAVGMQGLCEFSLGQHEAALKTLLRARSLGVKRDPEIEEVATNNRQRIILFVLIVCSEFCYYITRYYFRKVIHKTHPSGPSLFSPCFSTLR